jgi:hypothetical protein
MILPPPLGASCTAISTSPSLRRLCAVARPDLYAGDPDALPIPNAFRTLEKASLCPGGRHST